MCKFVCPCLVLFIRMYVESDDEDSDEDDSDSDWTSSEEEGEEGEGALDDTVCPPGCEEALFSLACELREKRLDLEDALAEEKKQLEMTRKELDSLKKKAKVLESGVKTAHNEMQAFQVGHTLSHTLTAYTHTHTHTQDFTNPSEYPYFHYSTDFTMAECCLCFSL